MGRYGDIDYARMVKIGMALGFAAFVVGAAGEVIGHAYFEPMPGWEDALLLDLEILGIAGMLFSPIVFGILLPLTE